MNFAIDQTAAWKKKAPFQESYTIKNNPIPFCLYIFLHLLFQIKYKN